MRKEYFWNSIDTQLGSVYVAVNERGSVVMASCRERPDEFLVELERLGRAHRDEEATRGAVRQLGEYFAGRRRAFDLDVDLGALTPFRRRVLEETLKIPYGEVWTYKELAAACGKPGAARAVGGALASNPIAIVVPCHRVIASDGSLGGYSGWGGLSTKRALLELEGVEYFAGQDRRVAV